MSIVFETTTSKVTLPTALISESLLVAKEESDLHRKLRHLKSEPETISTDDIDELIEMIGEAMLSGHYETGLLGVQSKMTVGSMIGNSQEIENDKAHVLAALAVALKGLKHLQCFGSKMSVSYE